MSSIIELKNVTFEYKSGEEGRVVRALDGVDLAIEEGSFTGIIGVNGSGKSTLAKNMNGLMLPTEGEVLVKGMNTRSATCRRMSVNSARPSAEAVMS